MYIWPFININTYIWQRNRVICSHKSFVSKRRDAKQQFTYYKTDHISNRMECRLRWHLGIENATICSKQNTTNHFNANTHHSHIYVTHIKLSTYSEVCSLKYKRINVVIHSHIRCRAIYFTCGEIFHFSESQFSMHISHSEIQTCMQAFCFRIFWICCCGFSGKRMVSRVIHICEKEIRWPNV